MDPELSLESLKEINKMSYLWFQYTTIEHVLQRRYTWYIIY